MGDVIRVARLVVVVAFVGSLWACYTTVTVPGSEAVRLRELTKGAPEVSLVGMSERVTVRPDTEVTLVTEAGARREVVPAALSYSATGLKLGRASDARAPVVLYEEILRLDVKRFSLGRTLGLTLPLGGVALVVLLEVFLLCAGGTFC